MLDATEPEKSAKLMYARVYATHLVWLEMLRPLSAFSGTACPLTPSKLEVQSLVRSSLASRHLCSVTLICPIWLSFFIAEWSTRSSAVMMIRS